MAFQKIQFSLPRIQRLKIFSSSELLPQEQQLKLDTYMFVNGNRKNNNTKKLNLSNLRLGNELNSVLAAIRTNYPRLETLDLRNNKVLRLDMTHLQGLTVLH